MLDLIQIKKKLIDRLRLCEDSAVESGWEELFLSKVIKNGNITKFFGHKLNTNTNRRRGGYTTSFTQSKRQQIINSLIQHLILRFERDDTLQSAIKPIGEMSSSATIHELRKCHSSIIPDLDEQLFLSEYYEAAEMLKSYQCEHPLTALQKLIEIRPDMFSTVKCALSRTLATKPHSADVERLINTYNKFKNDDRFSLSPVT
ncbi:hypothetical protein Bhyg_07614 [Pseudolycoriella hygida]|uniref:Uncharacterized protein n=1 Tax=Pseudolycoriella hygida TaxID=35572 RepID=A0A9Q0N3C8_9DIPT|nr:hypothetical protein Bhyg_07614 [Pseudolycoriella hygida]